MVKPKIYITGASCSGVSTLGKTVSARLGIPQIDVDDFYWIPTDPPYSVKRAPEQRISLIADRMNKAGGWVLTGSFTGWGDILIQDVDLIVFLYTPTSVRLQRLDQREAERYGARIIPGGDLYKAHMAFREWASQYDDPLFRGRNRVQHERWLDEQAALVIRLPGNMMVQLLADAVEFHLQWRFTRSS